ncbi:MAG: hypothetical protein FIB01_14235, partial [Gemmatimonadetes bacterium]|nr:hypothetical protein [Gemmatimonadota bacterium]
AGPAAPAREHRHTFYVATRNGGVWKTENSGTTFEPIFDSQDQQSIGAVAVAPSDARVVWVGTGESYVARFSYSGDGVNRSTDAGKTWRRIGLTDSHHIVRIIIHPRDPNTVYVASMGHLHTPNAERGVFRTRDGGTTWQKVLYIDDKVGVIDLAMDPSDPNVLYAASYEKYRYPWHLDIGGPGSGIYKTTDAGDRWRRLEGGLPTGRIGRIGLDVARSNPKVLYAVIENGNPRDTTSMRVSGGYGQVFRSDDAGESWRLTHDPKIDVGGKAPYSFNMLRIDPQNPDQVWVTSVYLTHSSDGGRTWQDNGTNDVLFTHMFGDVRTLWIDPEDPQHMLVGSDGGVNLTYDGGRTVMNLDNLALGEIYAVNVDMDDPYHVYAGLQDHDSWRAPVNGFAGAVGLEQWVTVGGGDGMYNAVDPTDSRWVYNTEQFGSHRRADLQAGTRASIMPRRPQGQPRLRWTWTTPVVLSPHDPKTVYTGAQVVLRSRDRGDTWEEISPDLTTNDATKQNGSGNIQYCTITTLAESAHTAGVIWAGTDDGKVQVTRDAGGSWTDVTAALVAAGAPANFWVTRVAPSRHAAGTAFVTITGFHRDDARPYVFRTDDFGGTWRSLAASLPAAAAANVIADDPRNPNLLYLGTDRGLFVSIDGGIRWARLKANMPTVPVRDLMVHPRENYLVVGTHGRGLWITDVTPLQELSEAILGDDAYLFAIEPRGYRVESGWGNYELFGDDILRTPNEPNGITINWWLRATGTDSVTITISDSTGTAVRTLKAPARAGLQRIVWDLRRGREQTYPPGEYAVTLEAAGKRLTQRARVKPPVVLPRGS